MAVLICGKVFLQEKELNLGGSRWQIGEGNISVFRDPWLPRPSLFRPITLPNSAFTDLRVADLIDNRMWNLAKLNDTFWPVDVDVIRSIPLSFGDSGDILIWHYEENALNQKFSAFGSGQSGKAVWWKRLWNLKMPSKAKHFMQRAFNNIIPTTLNLTNRGVSFSKSCSRCGAASESVDHALSVCQMSKSI